MHPVLISTGKKSARVAVIGTIALCLHASFLFAQASLSTHTLILPDTSYLGSADTAFVTIKNTGDTSYTGPVTIYFSTDTITYAPFSLCSGSSITLNPSDTIRAICYMSFKIPDFQTGSNIVVVWSSGNIRALPADTARGTVFIKTLSGIHETNLNESVSVYPTLAKDFITVELRTDAFPGTLLPESIRVTDIFGRRIREIESVREGKNKIQVNISKLSRGFYLMEISLPSNRRITAKFFKTD